MENENKFIADLKIWQKEVLSPYCLKTCKNSCCDCSNEGVIHIDQGHEYLFKKFKMNGRSVPYRNFINPGSKINSPHLFRDKAGNWYFSGGLCPNYNPKDKKCMIHNQHPMCKLFPLVKEGEKEYKLVTSCELYKMDENKEPLKSLLEICHQNDIKLKG